VKALESVHQIPARIWDFHSLLARRREAKIIGMELSFTPVANEDQFDSFPQDKGTGIFLAYANPRLCNRAMALLHDVATSTANPERMNCTVCHFDMLRELPLRRAAARQAATAGLVAIAARDGWALPEEVNEWIGLWLSAKTDRPTALAALVETDQREFLLASGISFRLREIARLGEMDFMTRDPADSAEARLRKRLKRALSQGASIEGQSAGGSFWSAISLRKLKPAMTA